MGRVKSLIMLSKRDLRTSKKVVDQQLKQLEEMQEYCEATRCRRNVLVEHFGEQCSYERLCNEEVRQLCEVPESFQEQVSLFVVSCSILSLWLVLCFLNQFTFSPFVFSFSPFHHGIIARRISQYQQK